MAMCNMDDTQKGRMQSPLGLYPAYMLFLSFCQKGAPSALIHFLAYAKTACQLLQLAIHKFMIRHMPNLYKSKEQTCSLR